jgi:hypothetical protein
LFELKSLQAALALSNKDFIEQKQQMVAQVREKPEKAQGVAKAKA